MRRRFMIGKGMVQRLILVVGFLIFGLTTAVQAEDKRYRGPGGQADNQEG